MSKGITESVVEQCSLNWLRWLGYETLSGLDIAPGEPAAERADYTQVFLFDRLQTKLEEHRHTRKSTDGHCALLSLSGELCVSKLRS